MDFKIKTNTHEYNHRASSPDIKNNFELIARFPFGGASSWRQPAAATELERLGNILLAWKMMAARGKLQKLFGIEAPACWGMAESLLVCGSIMWFDFVLHAI